MIIESITTDDYSFTKEEFQISSSKKFTIITYKVGQILVKFYNDRLYLYRSHYPKKLNSIELYVIWNHKGKLSSFRYNDPPGPKAGCMMIWPLGEREDIDRNDLLYAQLLERVMHDIANVQRPGVVDAVRVLPMPIYNEILEHFRVF